MSDFKLVSFVTVVFEGMPFVFFTSGKVIKMLKSVFLDIIQKCIIAKHFVT